MMDEPCIHFSYDTTTHKVLRVGYYWPMLFKVSYAYARKCQTFQKSVGWEKNPSLPLQPITIDDPLQKMGDRHHW